MSVRNDEVYKIHVYDKMTWFFSLSKVPRKCYIVYIPVNMDGIAVKLALVLASSSITTGKDLYFLLAVSPKNTSYILTLNPITDMLICSSSSAVNKDTMSKIWTNRDTLV